jgi:hypothetical protein
MYEPRRKRGHYVSRPGNRGPDPERRRRPDRFKNDARSCSALKNGIVITVSERTSLGDHPGALAYAMPFERTHIVVFYDRILTTVRPESVPSLLGHVLAHEVAHMFQGIEHHASTGVMKERWDHSDYVEMQRHPLRFTDEDLLLIRQGLRIRASPKGAAATQPLK